MKTGSVRRPTPLMLSRRREKFLPNGWPRWVRCYDNGGKTIDRYCAIFTGRYGHLTGNETWLLFMSNSPFSPQGIGTHGSLSYNQRPDWQHKPFGKAIGFLDLPKDCQYCVLRDYVYLWGLVADPENEDEIASYVRELIDRMPPGAPDKLKQHQRCMLSSAVPVKPVTGRQHHRLLRGAL